MALKMGPSLSLWRDEIQAKAEIKRQVRHKMHVGVALPPAGRRKQRPAMPRTVTVTRKPRDPAPDSRESPEDLRSRIATLEGDLKTKQQLEKDLAKEIKTKQQRVKTVKAETQGVKKEITRLRKTLRLSATSGIEEENARRLDKLPRDVWSKIFDHLEENDLFPLALSCKYFRQKQRELVARTGRGRQSGRKSGLARLALKTYSPQ